MHEVPRPKLGFPSVSTSLPGCPNLFKLGVGVRLRAHPDLRGTRRSAVSARSAEPRRPMWGARGSR